MLGALNLLLIGLWTGMYIFTTFVVSPAFVEFFPDAGLRAARRRSVGKRYARLSGPLALAALVVIVGQGLTAGLTAALSLELALLLLIQLLVGLHVVQAQAGKLGAARWLTNFVLAAGLLMCGAAVTAW